MAAVALSAAEKQRVNDALEAVRSLPEEVPELLGHVQSAFRSTLSLCELLLSIPSPPDTDDGDIWNPPGGSGRLSNGEKQAMSTLAAKLRRVVNGCPGAGKSCRRSLAASTELAEVFVGDISAERHLELVVPGLMAEGITKRKEG